MNGIAAVRTAGIVKVDDIEFRLYLVAVLIVNQMVVGNHREVGKLEVVNILTESLFNLLLDERVYYGIGFSRTRRAEYDGCTERIHDIDPAVIPFFLVIETGGQINGIFIGEQVRFLLETFVLVVENIVHEVVLQQAAYVQPRHQEADIADRHRENIDSGIRLYAQWQRQYPPIQEKEHKPHAHERPDFRPCDFFLLHARRTQTGQSEQQDGEQFGVNDTAEQPRRAVEVHQDFIHHADVHAPQPDGFVAEPVHVHDH